MAMINKTMYERMRIRMHNGQGSSVRRGFFVNNFHPLPPTLKQWIGWITEGDLQMCCIINVLS
jgi:hypothetical protein